MNRIRRALMAAGAFGAVALLSFPAVANSPAEKDDILTRKFAEIESRLDARLGAMILDTETGTSWTHRADERFPLNSTLKAFACAALLTHVDTGEENLGRVVTFSKEDLVAHSPITEKHIADGMSLGDLCRATTSLSDNTAANLVLDSIGGPEGFTAFMRSIGDNETRLDRWETELNEAKPGDPRDTTTPAAAMRSLHDLVVEDILSERSRDQLIEWLAGNEVGGPLLRASLPEGWRIADRTGAGGYGSRSIIAVIWPPERDPVVAAIYLTQTEADMDERNAAIAEIGRTLVSVLEN